jgi:hypothetical protein
MSRPPKALKPIPPAPPLTPAEFLERFAPLLRQWFGGDVEIDFCWSGDAIMIFDMRAPSHIRAETLVTAAELDEAAKFNDEIKRRAKAFLEKGPVS